MTSLKTKAVDQLLAMGAAARSAGRALSRTPSRVKDHALLNIAEALESQQDKVLEANQRDYEAARNDGLNRGPAGPAAADPGQADGHG